ncbi:hypothetical protein KAR48_05260 [bacterium]|nr:hypothetical protein [bacterium]
MNFKNLTYSMQRRFRDLWQMSVYNQKIIFANKFIYFLLAAVLFFLMIVTINIFSDNNFSSEDVYNTLLFPGILLIFYPSTFGIQNDADARMLEMIFGIPDYRYKVWLVRLGMMTVIVYGLILLLSIVSSAALYPVPVFEMSLQLMFPIVFLGALGFALSTVVKNGNGTAVVMVVIGLIFWISAGIVERSKWNIFLNPFSQPSNLNEALWRSIVYNNRIILFVGIILTVLWGLYRLQKREALLQ